MTQPTFNNQESGMTAVELLITLFVAAAFLIAGYQLFNVVIRDGGEVRAEAKASNLAYGLLRQYSDSVSNPCVETVLAFPDVPETIDGLAEASLYVHTDCPYPSTNAVTRITAEVTYGFPVKTVKHTTYVDKSKGI